MEENCLLELQQVTVTPTQWGEGQAVLPIVNDISIRIDKGQFITLLGRNGSGKSTLAKVIAGLRTTGVTGKVLRGAETTVYGNRIPMVMQQPEAAMVGATPWEDVVLMLEQNEIEPNHIVSLAEQALRQVGMGERMHQSIETLSGGQKQLVAIAGCLAAHSPFLVLDEVTSMLDPDTAEVVLERVRSIHKSGVTIIWITQKLEELRPGDRIIAMNDGRIVYDGFADGWFARSLNGKSESVCEQLGFEAPYSARVAWELEQLGYRLRPFPYTADMLAEAVKQYER